MTALIVQLGDRSNLSANFMTGGWPALGQESQEVINRSTALRNKPAVSEFGMSKSSDESNEENLFGALARIKILTSHVAMHMDTEWRSRLFAKMDSLHDVDEWATGDQPINESSFFNFLRAILKIMPERYPSFGLADNGNLIAGWINGEDRLTLEFLPDARVRWVLANYNELGVDRFAGNVHISHLADSLAPYKPAHWFRNENKS